MVVICPKCKTKLRIDDSKLKPEGSRFKCPKCSTFLLVKKPVHISKKEVDNNRILVAHSNPNTHDEIISLLTKNGYQTITASDGIEAMVKTIRQLPFLVIIEVSLPKIYGFEVCKRLKARAETKETKFILVSSIYDKGRYKREPASFYDADDYIEEHSISELLIEKVNALRKPTPLKEKIEKPDVQPLAEKPETEIKVEAKPEVEAVKPQVDDFIERAKRLTRTIISDIYLYNMPKADKAIKNDTFYTDFSAEIKEGLKLYESRIPEEIRTKGDFFMNTIREFIENKKKVL